MKDKKEGFASLYGKVEEILAERYEINTKLGIITNLLRDKITYYDWVGFYLVDETKRNELVLGPFSGAPTEHTKIPFGRGICGQAADTGQTFVVQDVSKEMNYLSCSSSVRSEIVVPILREGEIIGELDIDSHEISPFTEEDRDFLERVCGLLGEAM